MTKKSAEILHMQDAFKGEKRYSKSFQSVMQRWHRVEAELDTIIEQDEMHQMTQNTRQEIESKYEQAGHEQRSIFETVTSLNANKLEDVLAKLELWKSVTCPSSASEEQLSLTDKMLLSAYDDLQRITSFKD